MFSPSAVLIFGLVFASIEGAVGAEAAKARIPLKREERHCEGFKWGAFSTVEIAKPVKVRAVTGTVELDLGGRNEPQFIEGAQFQICGPATNHEIRAVASDEQGKFKLDAAPGRYMFVAAKDGFQAVSGTLLVSRCSFRRTIRVRLPLGY